jgi:catechol 2,3-dioxygenase-like lactoylglutathione lyase family enzyme
MTMAPHAEIRRFLHANYNCRNLEGLERWYTELFALKPVMRSDSASTDSIAFGLREVTTTSTIFLYDHRGGRRTTSLELVGWHHPDVIGQPYEHAWEHGIQSVGYCVNDLDEVAGKAVAGGGRVVRRVDGALLLRDPEGVAVEVLASDVSPPEAHHMRVVVSDLNRTIDWYSGVGLTLSPQSIVVPGAQLWEGDAEHTIAAESAMVGTDDPTYSLVFNTWSGPPPVGPPYLTNYHNGIYRFAVAVDDVYEAFENLRAAKLAVYPPYTFALPGTPITDGLTILFIRDPDGILVELVQRPRSFFR